MADLSAARSRAASTLSRAQETRLARRAERGDAVARERLIEANLGLVAMLARPFRGRGVPFADLVQEGTLGLVQAVERFDHRRKSRLSTYAAWWIRRSLLDCVAGARLVSLPPRASRQLAAIGRARDELARAGPAVSDAAIAARTELPEARVRSLRAAPRVTASLDVSSGAGASTLGDLLADTGEADPAEEAIAVERAHKLLEMLAMLPERHRLVLAWRYGLARHAACSHAEIGLRLGVGEERSRQIEREALQRLRSIAPAFRLAA